MASIRKRTGKKGVLYQVRYADPRAAAGYSYKPFETAKEARAFRETVGSIQTHHHPSASLTVCDAVNDWLDICEKEGLNGREPVTDYSLQNYKYRAKFIQSYPWAKPLDELGAPDIVAFRSWLLRGEISRSLASKVLFSFQSMMNEMKVRGILTHNCAAGIGVRDESRYDEPVEIPSKADIKALLQAADELANVKNETIAKAWRRYRPMLYLAVDSGMRPQEYLAAARANLVDGGIRIDRAIEGGDKSISVTKTPAGRRFIELSPPTFDLLRAYADDAKGPNNYDLIFPDRSGSWQSRRNWQRRGFNVACERAGLGTETTDADGNVSFCPKYRPYDLRHFFASYHIAKKTNLKKLQKLMGHTNIETTLNVYGHLISDDNSASAGLLSDLR